MDITLEVIVVIEGEADLHMKEVVPVEEIQNTAQEGTKRNKVSLLLK